MATLVLADRIQETGTVSTGTGSVNLAGAVVGFKSFITGIGNGNVTYYAIYDPATFAWEVGLGTVTAGTPNTLSRTTVLSNSLNTTALISFSTSNTLTVFCTYPSEKSINYDQNGTATIGSALSYTDTGIVSSFASTVAGYNQVILQNLSAATNASTNFNVSNNTATATTGFAELGINSSTFSNGAGAFNIAGAAYLASASTDLAIGTYGAYNLHFVTNSNNTDAMTIYNDGGASFGGLGSPGIGNVAVNNAVVGFTAITSSATAVSLVASSTQVQGVTGTIAQRINLPQATTLLKGTFYTISNASSANVTVYDNAGTLLETITPGGAAQFLCTANGTSAGSWGIRVFAASNTAWGTTALNYTGNITGATWNGVTIASGYGGTGLTTFTGANNALYSTSSSALAAGTLPTAAGGTGVTNTPTNGQLLIGNGTSYTVASLTQGSGIAITNGSGSVTVAVASTYSEFASGTAILFQQTTAPTNWTKVTTYNNYALRVVSGTVSSGGTVPFTTAFASQTPSGSVSTSVSAVTGSVGVSLSSGGSVNLSSGGSVNLSGGGSVSGYTLTTSDIPSHNHLTALVASSSIGYGTNGSLAGVAGASYTTSNATYTSSTGSGGSHSHGFSNPSYSFSNPSYSLTNPSYSGSFSFSSGSASSSFAGNAINLAVQYVDAIICTKN